MGTNKKKKKQLGHSTKHLILHPTEKNNYNHTGWEQHEGD